MQAVKLFAEPFDKLLNAVDAEVQTAAGPVNKMTYSLPPEQKTAIGSSLEDWTIDRESSPAVGRATRRCGPAPMKTSGWDGSDITEDQLAHRERFDQFAADVKAGGFKHALLLGMGGSSLCPEVLRLSFGKIDGFPELHVLDSTDPAQIRAIEKKIDLSKTLFIVSSKSGSTLEPNIFKQYFFERSGRDGSRFIAITDPGSQMQKVAEQDHFRKIFFGSAQSSAAAIRRCRISAWFRRR